MGIFTDIYNVGATVSRPVSGILRYGARQADVFFNDLVDEDDTGGSGSSDSTAPETDATDVHGVVVVRRMEDLTGGEIAKLSKLSSKGHSVEDISIILSTDDREITINAIVDATEKLN